MRRQRRNVEEVVSSANATIQNNTLTSDGTGLYLDTVTGLTAGAVSGNTFTGSNTGLQLFDLSGLTIGDSEDKYRVIYRA